MGHGHVVNEGSSRYFRNSPSTRRPTSLVPVPDHSSAEPKALATLANQVCSGLNKTQTYEDLFTALDSVLESAQDSQSDPLIVLCGSLYLIGYLFQHGNFAEQTILN